MKKKIRKPYWRRTKLLLIMTLILPLLVIFSMPALLGLLDGFNVLGFPASYFAVAHGTALIAVAAVLRYVTRQENVDRWHGANDEF
ncbi:MAG: DUF4212 domain-containing protein [Rhizobiales bacterium]|nr:DUF4212 domain-containing protein [Hyphomicrobiales bacterium]